MKPAINTLLMALLLPFFTLAQDNTPQAYKDAQTEINDMLAGARPLSYERAIYLMENAYWGGNLDYKAYTQLLDANTVMIAQLANMHYKSADSFTDAGMNVPHLLGKTAAERKQMYDKAVLNYAIYSYMTDTALFLADSNLYIHLPAKYTFADPMGSTQWANTQVAHLLVTGRGNCFAMASLYKIFADRLQTGAAISTAPGHIYISHADENGIMYNVEPGSKNSFPGTGTLATITYSSDAAVANGIAMRSLTDKEAVATCLVYLAKSYEKQYNTNADAFAMECANTALQYDAKNLNAMLLQAEVLERQLLQQNLLITQLQQTATFSEYETLLTKLYALGYREMPQEMKNTLVALYNKEKTATNCNKNDNTIGVSGGLFPETVPYCETEQYGRTLYNAKKGKITGFAPQAPLYNNYNFDPVVFAWNMEPLSAKYPHLSPYVVFANNPTTFADPDGREIQIHYVDNNGKSQVHIFNVNEKYAGENSYVRSFYEAYYAFKAKETSTDAILASRAKEISIIIEELANNTTRIVDVYSTKKDAFFKANREFDINNNGKQSLGGVYWNPTFGVEFRTYSGSWGNVSPAVMLIHEFSHVRFLFKNGITIYDQYGNTGHPDNDDLLENDAMGYEGNAAIVLDQNVRPNHGTGRYYKTAGPTTTDTKRQAKQKSRVGRNYERFDK